ncbi:hypothetical protein HYY75_03125, partial [bacterium]|nr:hypothetical protein [bacterium]
AKGAEPDNQEISDLISAINQKINVLDFSKAANEAEARGSLQEALDLVNRALGISENDPTLKARAESLSARIEKNALDKAHREAEALAKRQAKQDFDNKFSALLKAAKNNEENRVFDAALLSYQKALEFDKDNEEIKASIERVKQLSKEDNERIDKLGADLAKANNLFSSENYDQAYTILRELINNPEQPADRILPKLIETCLKLERLDDAEGYTIRLRGIQPNSDELDYFQGTLDFKRGNFSKAGEPLNRVYSKNKGFRPDLPGMVWRLTFEKAKWFILLFALFFGSKAFVAGKESLARMKKSGVEGSVEKAMKSGDFPRAISLIESRLSEGDNFPTRRQMILTLADAYLRTGRNSDACTKANDILTKDPKNIVAQRILGEGLFQMGDKSPENVDKIYNLFKIDETRRDILSFLVNFYKEQQSESKNALEALHKQISFSPDDTDTLLHLANMYGKRENFNQQNLKIFERASKFDPERPEYVFGHAQCLQQMGKRSEAEEIILQGKKRWPNSGLFSSEPQQPARREPSSSVPVKSGALKTQTTMKMKEMAAAKEETQCVHCGAKNLPREYYCKSCGKPIK